VFFIRYIFFGGVGVQWKPFKKVFSSPKRQLSVDAQARFCIALLEPLLGKAASAGKTTGAPFEKSASQDKSLRDFSVPRKKSFFLDPRK
jgi:hypothetical protein